MHAAQLKAIEESAQQQTDHYAEHLAEVDTTNPVVATEDILSTRKIPIVKKGTRINRDIAHNILQHKLIKPLEHQVQLEHCLNGEAILTHVLTLLDKYPELKLIHNNSGYTPIVEQLIESSVLSPLLAQKLTVFQQRLPAEFEKTLFCTWLAVNIALTAKLDNQHITITYLASLGHDLGMLHISPHIFSKKEKLAAAEWRAVQSHVVTSYLFLKNLGGIYSDAANAVLEHHECCDGTGYPFGKTMEQLGICGQIIAMADSLQAIRVNQLEAAGRNMLHTIPFLQMNNTTHTETVYRATSMLIRKVKIEYEPTHRFSSLTDLVTYLSSRGEDLDKASVILFLLLYLSLPLNLGKAGKAMLRVLGPVTKRIRSSGLIEEHIFNWLSDLETDCDTQCINELCEMELMQNELYFQLKKARNAYISFLEQEPSAGHTQEMAHLHKLVTTLDEFLL